MEEKIKRLLKWSEGKKTNPMTLELNITNKCNLRCRMCWLRSANLSYEQELTDKELLQIIDEAIGLGVKEFRIPGSGEPMMRKDVLFRIMHKIKNNGRNGLLISNGTLFEEEDVKKLVEMDWDILTLSLDGPNPEINDYIRDSKGAFKKTLNTIKLVKRYKENKKTEKPWLRMNTVLTNKNYDKLDELVDLGKKFGFKEILLQPMTVFSETGKKLKIKETEREIVDDNLKSANKKAKRFKIKTNMNLFINNKIVEMANEMDKIINKEISHFDGFLSSPCFEPFYNLIITPNGEVGPCAIFGGDQGINVKEKSLKDIWFGEYFTQIREKLLEKELFSFCSNCCVPIFLENKRLRKKLKEIKKSKKSNAI